MIKDIYGLIASTITFYSPQFGFVFSVMNIPGRSVSRTYSSTLVTNSKTHLSTQNFSDRKGPETQVNTVLVSS